MKSYNERIRELREGRALSQEQVAQAIGVKQRTYSNYELGMTEPRIATLIQLAAFYKVSVDYLLGVTDHKN